MTRYLSDTFTHEGRIYGSIAMLQELWDTKACYRQFPADIDMLSDELGTYVTTQLGHYPESVVGWVIAHGGEYIPATSWRFPHQD